MFSLTCFSDCVLRDSRSLVFTRYAVLQSVSELSCTKMSLIPPIRFFSVGKWFSAGNMSHVTEYCWIFFFLSVLSMQHICFLVLFPLLFYFLRKLNLFLWVRRNQSCILLMYLPELSTAAMWMGSKTVSCTALLKLHVDWLCVVSVMQYSNLWREPVWKSCSLSKPVPGAAAGHASL